MMPVTAGPAHRKIRASIAGRAHPRPWFARHEVLSRQSTTSKPPKGQPFGGLV